MEIHSCISVLAAAVQPQAGWVYMWFLWLFYKKETPGKKLVGNVVIKGFISLKTRLSFILKLLLLIIHCFIVKTIWCRLKYLLEGLFIFYIQICDHPGLAIISWNVSYWLHVSLFALIMLYNKITVLKVR